VRLKSYLEVRGADGGTWRRICGLPALWAGILYDDTALDAAWDLVKDWTAEERQAMRAAVPMLAFKTPFRGGDVLGLARRMLDIATEGLQARARDGVPNEKGFLEPLQELVDRGYTRAEELLALYRGEWKGDLSRLCEEYNFL
jgi:glutamate--cysteine ligase